MPKNLYVFISLQEFEAFLTGKGFSRRVRTPDAREWKFAKFIDGTEYGIVVYSSMDVQDGHQRGYGKDAIRCQLHHHYDTDPLLDLSATRRIRNWQVTLGGKIDLLERLCQSVQACPMCGADMRPIRGQFGKKVLWVCFRRFEKLAPCKGVRYIESELADKLADDWPRS